MTAPRPAPTPEGSTQARLAALAAALAGAHISRAAVRKALAPLGISSKVIRQVWALNDAIKRTVPAAPASAKTASRSVAKVEPQYRAAYLIEAAKRLESGATTPDTERHYAVAHIRAQRNRSLSARQIDRAETAYGPTLGWYAKHDKRVSPDCARMDGTNFDVNQPPEVGYPGAVHPHCRCTPGPPHASTQETPMAVAASNIDDVRRVALTARTPIASTVHQPTVGPGGPGLFHMKGAQLPAYIQHVANELKKKGKTESQAVSMAIGIIKNWAHGHDGKGGKVSAQVQAAAQKALAEWNALRAKAKATPNKGGSKSMSTSEKRELLSILLADGATPEQAARAIRLAATPKHERAAGRRALAKKGHALPDGSFPIPNKAYLKKAKKAIGRASPSKKAKVRRLIKKRARQLGVKASEATPVVVDLAAGYNGGMVDLATKTKPGQRYRHGWILITPGGDKKIAKMKLPERLRADNKEHSKLPSGTPAQAFNDYHNIDARKDHDPLVRKKVKSKIAAEHNVSPKDLEHNGNHFYTHKPTGDAFRPQADGSHSRVKGRPEYKSKRGQNREALRARTRGTAKSAPRTKGGVSSMSTSELVSAYVKTKNPRYLAELKKRPGTSAKKLKELQQAG